MNKKMTMPKPIARDFGSTCEIIHRENEIIESFESARLFYKERETYHQESADWYFQHAREMESKAWKHIKLAEKAFDSGYEYLCLIAIATLKILGRV